MRCFTFALLAALGIGGCTSQTDVFRTDLTHQAGVYVVGYTEDQAVREALENQLVADLVARDMQAWPSHDELTDLAGRSAADVVAAAERHDAVGVIVINQVAADASDSIVDNPDRVTPLHPDLQTFFSQSRGELTDEAAADQLVFAEVNLFLLDGPASRLYWSGTTWSFHADGKGTAVRGISETIADQLRDAKAEFSRNPFTE